MYTTATANPSPASTPTLRRPRTTAEFFRAWADAILCLRDARDAVSHFGSVHAHTLECDVGPLGDPSFEDLNNDIGGIEWQLDQSLRLLDNCPPPPVMLLVGGLEDAEDDTPTRREARKLVREIAAECFASDEAAGLA